MCRCTSYCYGDVVGTIRVFTSGDLEFNCDLFPWLSRRSSVFCSFPVHICMLSCLCILSPLFGKE
ncbi:hypothetical protein HanRHA438_Chr12g0573331 [Helianthus annuus]|uniref:Developmental regulator, ULTRAPETALA n=1 Tax=Helianthus annuus TaxID=4232 RepID=A0A9K3MXV3_HELAN|nr:putative developmental regulator, ULTRAPETALA [Helianthus annuus]KAJ0490923.1 hypothetical protein HanHA300_Chr12g0461121 [Helianthus annuus]KAJ0506827.1 hypothetical protein HanHA89_Chr12g0486521 [Helianthus annuus]KAJ0676492.1 hypothetical protein HanLR1_Chr12g0463421 [Helianthus annuus]KAJ0679703.1 hypothetical protein HanOQP8_Chr12g0462641 [Helianthus annuus]